MEGHKLSNVVNISRKSTSIPMSLIEEQANNNKEIHKISILYNTRYRDKTSQSKLKYNTTCWIRCYGYTKTSSRIKINCAKCS